MTTVRQMHLQQQSIEPSEQNAFLAQAPFPLRQCLKIPGLF